MCTNCQHQSFKTLLGAALLNRMSTKAGTLFWELIAESLAMDIYEKYLKALQKGEKQAMQVLMAAGKVAESVLQQMQDAFSMSVSGVMDAYDETMKLALSKVYAHGKLGSLNLLNKMGMPGQNQVFDVIRTFRIVDRNAVKWLTEDTMFWVRGFWDNQLGSKIALTIRETIFEEGQSISMAADRLRDQLGFQYGQNPFGMQNYWRVVANQAAGRASTFGAVSGFEEGGATVFQYSNPMDTKTTEICASLHNRQFTVKSVVDLRDKMMEAKSPEEVKDIHPWLSFKRIEGKTRTELEAMGAIIPPLHALCRSSIEAVSYEQADADRLEDWEVKKPEGVKPDQALIDAGILEPDQIVYGNSTEYSRPYDD